MTKKIIPLLLIITLSGCAHQLFEEENTPTATDSNISQPEIKPTKAAVNTVTPYKKVTKNPSGDAYND
jgi:hypothetical protein